MHGETKPRGVGIEMITRDHLVAAGMKYGRTLWNTGVLPDWAIRELVTIEDFVDYDECPSGVVSYGLTSAGYDIRVAGNFKVFTNAHCAIVSPKNIKPECFMNFDLTGHEWGTDTHPGVDEVDQCRKCDCLRSDNKARFKCGQAPADTPVSILIPPNCFALAETVEVLHIPRNVVCWCIGKSTYARCGINMNFTPFEPGWRGVVTVEIINATPMPVEIFAYEGIGQAQYFMLAGNPEKAYADKKNAKYQDQKGLTLPSVK